MFESQDEAQEAINNGTVQAGHVLLSAMKVQKADQECQKCLHLPLLLSGRGLGKKVALITDGRFSGATEVFLLVIFHLKQLKAVRLLF